MPLVTEQMKRRFLDRLQHIHGARLMLRTPEGVVHNFGSDGPETDLVIRDWSVLPALALRGDVGLGESWVRGLWHTSCLETLLTMALRNLDQLSAYAQPGMLARLRMLASDRVLRANSRQGSSRNIRAHYDVGNEFYQLWLDPGMTYSSALFEGDGDTDLERAQARKNDRILSRLAPGDSLLEIGCGWGSFAERAANGGRQVTGLTLSPSQQGYADARLDGQAEIRMLDYRDATGRYDNIVSIEMIEAVGERYWPVYFATLKARLAPCGHAVLQAITVPDAEFPRYRGRSDFIRRHTFPGGMLVCNAALAREAERAGLRIRESFAFGAHYARTCRIWEQRMMQEQPRLQRLGYDASFLRSWQFYLSGCAATFSTGRTDVVQVQLEHALPAENWTV